MSTIIQAGLASAEAAVNQALKFDPGSQQKLLAVDGKLLAIEITQPQISVYVRLGYPLQLLSRCEQEADATLSGEITAFINVAMTEDKQQALMKSDLQIRGSSQLALALADVMGQLDIDWEAMISKATGPVAAHLIGKQARGIVGWVKQTGEKFKNDWVEYFRDESQVVVHSTEAEDRFRAIHQLRLDTDRLEARIQRIQSQMQNPTPNKTQSE